MKLHQLIDALIVLNNKDEEVNAYLDTALVITINETRYIEHIEKVTLIAGIIILQGP